jgi:hypothetical protein
MPRTVPLPHIPNASPHAFRVLHHIAPNHGRLARRQLEQCGQHPNACRFSRAVWSQKGHQFALLHSNVDPAHGFDDFVLDTKCPRQSMRLDQWHR